MAAKALFRARWTSLQLYRPATAQVNQTPMVAVKNASPYEDFILGADG